MEKQELENNNKKEDDLKKRMVVELSKPVEFEKKMISEIDFSKVQTLKGEDIINITRIVRMDGVSTSNMEQTPEFLYRLAEASSGLPYQFFMQLSLHDAWVVKRRMEGFLLISL